MEKHIVILGAGPGGYETAIEASQLGFRVTLIDNHKVGGTCLHYGCIPTKTHYKHAKAIKEIKASSELGITATIDEIDYSLMRNRQLAISDNLQMAIEKSFKSLNIDYIQGHGYFEGQSLFVTKADKTVVEIIYDDLIIATGSSPKSLTIEGINLPQVITSKDLLELDYIPESMTVIGAGVIGMEFASIWNQLGTNVTVLEYLPGILPNVDTGLAKRLGAYSKKQGIKILTNAAVQSIASIDGNAVTTYIDKKGKQNQVMSEIVLMAVGRKPNISGYGLESTGIDLRNDSINVSDHFKTNAPNIYAIGDVINKGQLAHLATYQGKWLVNHLAGNHFKYDTNVPAAIFTFPEIASIGLTEDQLKVQGIDYDSHKMMFGAVGKAHALNETDGFMKVLTNNQDMILGVHIIGAESSIIIHEAALAMKHDISFTALKEMIHIHPSLSEIYIV